MSYGPPHRSSVRERSGAPRITRRAARGLLALILVSLSAAASAAASGVKNVPFTIAGSQSHAVAPGPGRYAVLPYRAKTRAQLNQAMAADTTVQGSTYAVTAGQDGNNYSFITVGPNVTAGSATANIPAELIPTIVTFTPTGDVYDPTTINSGCGETVSAVTGALTGPEFVRRNWYAGHTYIGHTQYPDAMQREEFWGNTNPHGSSPNYHVFVNPSYTENATTSVNAPEDSGGTCSEIGEIDMGTFDAAIQSFLRGFDSTTLPIILLKNVVLTTNSGTKCCVLGYHSAFTNSSGDTQTYAVADYITDGRFGGSTDLAALSHEIAEWANDPFGNNPTPSWGHLGQVSGCQNNLEVGDPLTGTTFGVPPTTPNSGQPTYHLQELAFFGWFYDFNSGVNGWYSSRGTFTSGASLCS